jgi:glycosyltransferase involved in cell wall biosynthesis
MKILYLSCHSILEYDELKLFSELGYDWFSLGSYVNPTKPADEKRPALSGKYDDHLISLAGRYSRDNLHQEQIDPFDVIIVMHIDEWIEKNWDKLKHKKVIWRSIGQSATSIEAKLYKYTKEGLKIVRYSPTEKNIVGYVGEDAIIRFYKDPEEFKDWNGNRNEVMTVGQSLEKRGEFCHYNVFNTTTIEFGRKVFGPGNEETKDFGGVLSYEDLKKAYRDYRAFFYTGTQPASYTLGFIEALMTGIPIVAIGPEFGNSIIKQNTYEVHKILENEKDGFSSDNILELKSYVRMLLADYKFAKKIGEAGRKKAIQMFGKETIKNQWKDFIESL